MAIDLNKCLGCQTCTAACKTQWTNRNGRDYMYWNNVESHPGRGYPRDWMSYNAGWQKGRLQLGEWPKLEEYGDPWRYQFKPTADDNQPTMRPDSEPTWGPNWEEDQGAGEYPNSFYFYLPRVCNHCSNPACVAACPRGAIKKRERDGIVIVDQELCRGIKRCIRACPYKKVYFNPDLGNPEQGIIGKSEKCLFCFPRVEQGLAPACARQCVGRIRFVSYLEDREGPVYKLAKEWKVALPLRPDFGTEPNVYYIPPIAPSKFDTGGRLTQESRIPLSYLEKLFGSQVHDALATLKKEMRKKAETGSSDLIDTLIGFKHSEMFRL